MRGEGVLSGQFAGLGSSITDLRLGLLELIISLLLLLLLKKLILLLLITEHEVVLVVLRVGRVNVDRLLSLAFAFALGLLLEGRALWRSRSGTLFSVKRDEEDQGQARCRGEEELTQASARQLGASCSSSSRREQPSPR